MIPKALPCENEDALEETDLSEAYVRYLCRTIEKKSLKQHALDCSVIIREILVHLR